MESTNARPDGEPKLRHATPSKLVQTISEGTAALGSPATATRPAGATATSTCGAVIAVTCVHVWPSAEVQTKASDPPLVVPYATKPPLHERSRTPGSAVTSRLSEESWLHAKPVQSDVAPGVVNEGAAGLRVGAEGSFDGEIPKGEADSAGLIEGESPAALQLATRQAIVRTTAKPRTRPRRGS